MMDGLETGRASAPLVSFVICSRNDMYADKMLARQQLALNVLAEQMRAFPFPAELIVVEWNSPPEETPLAEALQWPSFGSRVSVKIILVPGKFHRFYKDAEIHPFNAAAAWNIGIRRARGKFILPKAADTFYSNDLFEWMAKGDLDDHTMYRCDRYDVSQSVSGSENDLGKEILSSCDRNIEQRLARIPVHPGYGIPDLHTNGAGDFILLNRSYWNKIHGFEEAESAVAFDIDGLVMHGAHAAGAKEIVLPDNYKVFKVVHKSQFSKRTGRSYRSVWILLDFCMKALRLPFKWRISLRIRFDYPRRTIRGINGATFPSYARHFIASARQWARGNVPYYLNDPEWGHANEEFKTTVICSADWENSS